MESPLAVRFIREYIFTTQFASISTTDLKEVINNYYQGHPDNNEASLLLELLNKDSAQYYYCALSTLGQLNCELTEYIVHKLYNELAIRLVYRDVPYAEIEYNCKMQTWSPARGGLMADIAHLDVWTCRRLEGYSVHYASMRDLERMMVGSFMMRHEDVDTVHEADEECDRLNRAPLADSYPTVSSHLWVTCSRIYDDKMVAIPRAQIYELLNIVAQQCTAYSTLYYKALAGCISYCQSIIRTDYTDSYYMLKDNYRLFEMLNVNVQYCEFFLSCLGIRAYSYSKIRYELEYDKKMDRWCIGNKGLYLQETKLITFAQYNEYRLHFADDTRILRNIEYVNQRRYRGDLKELLAECTMRNQLPQYFTCSCCGNLFCGIADVAGVCPICRFRQGR